MPYRICSTKMFYNKDNVYCGYKQVFWCFPGILFLLRDGLNRCFRRNNRLLFRGYFVFLFLLLFLFAPFLIVFEPFLIGLVLLSTFLFLHAIVFDVFYGWCADSFGNFLFYPVLFVFLLRIWGYYRCSRECVEALFASVNDVGHTYCFGLSGWQIKWK